MELKYNMENYSEFFCIDADSPSGLRWKVDRYSGKNNSTIHPGVTG